MKVNLTTDVEDQGHRVRVQTVLTMVQTVLTMESVGQYNNATREPVVGMIEKAQSEARKTIVAALQESRRPRP